MHGYGKIRCSCGREARIVECLVGCYIHCVWCDGATCMCTTKADALRRWSDEKLGHFFIFCFE